MRPTKEQVDRALEEQRKMVWCGFDEPESWKGVLAAEVCALREELDKYVEIVGVNGVEFYSLENHLAELREAMSKLVAIWDFRIGRPKWQQVSDELAEVLAKVRS